MQMEQIGVDYPVLRGTRIPDMNARLHFLLRRLRCDRKVNVTVSSSRLRLDLCFWDTDAGAGVTRARVNSRCATVVDILFELGTDVSAGEQGKAQARTHTVCRRLVGVMQRRLRFQIS